jgi:hypothetical protein
MSKPQESTTTLQKYVTAKNEKESNIYAEALHLEGFFDGKTTRRDMNIFNKQVMKNAVEYKYFSAKDRETMKNMIIGHKSDEEKLKLLHLLEHSEFLEKIIGNQK